MPRRFKTCTASSVAIYRQRNFLAKHLPATRHPGGLSMWNGPRFVDTSALPREGVQRCSTSIDYGPWGGSRESNGVGLVRRSSGDSSCFAETRYPQSVRIQASCPPALGGSARRFIHRLLGEPKGSPMDAQHQRERRFRMG